jgi:hypothetical protein
MSVSAETLANPRSVLNLNLVGAGLLNKLYAALANEVERIGLDTSECAEALANPRSALILNLIGAGL